MPNDAVAIPQLVWQTRLPFAPQLPDFEPGLALAIGSGRRDEQPMPVAAIRYRMPDPVVRRYRGTVAPALWLVAVDIATGEVHAAPCMGQDAAPATYDPAANAVSPPGSPSLGGDVNVDIVGLLQLPPQAARYLVLAWLDEWTSAPRGLELPAGDRTPSPVRVPANSPAVARVAPVAPNAVAAGMAFIGPQAGRLRMSWQVAHPAPVVLLGYDLATRQLRWEVLARGDAAQARTGIAEIALPSFFARPSPDTAAMLLVAGGQAKSTGPLKW